MEVDPEAGSQGGCAAMTLCETVKHHRVSAVRVLQGQCWSSLLKVTTATSGCCREEEALLQPSC